MDLDIRGEFKTVIGPICRAQKSLRRGIAKPFTVCIFIWWLEVQKAISYHHSLFCSVCLHQKFPFPTQDIICPTKSCCITTDVLEHRHLVNLLEDWLWKISFYHYFLSIEITILVISSNLPRMITSVYFFFSAVWRLTRYVMWGKFFFPF